MNELEQLYFNSKRDLNDRKQIHQENNKPLETSQNEATEQKFVIDGKLDGLNAYTKANRSNMYAGAKMKKDNETVVAYYIRKHKVKKVVGYPISLKITWVEPDRRRDLDNISFATKFILDALVKKGIIPNDNQKYVTAIEHHVKVDKERPRVEVTIIES